MKQQLKVFTFGETAYRIGDRLMQEKNRHMEVIRFMHDKLQKPSSGSYVCGLDDDLQNYLTAEMSDNVRCKMLWWRRLWHRLTGRRQEKSTVVLIAGAGGKFGGEALTIAAQMAQNYYDKIVVILQMPFSFEGKVRRQRAEETLRKCEKYATRTIVFDNAVLSREHADKGIAEYFDLIEERIVAEVKTIGESS